MGKGMEAIRAVQNQELTGSDLTDNRWVNDHRFLLEAVDEGLGTLGVMLFMGMKRIGHENA
jgi:hypothetical protein